MTELIRLEDHGTRWYIDVATGRRLPSVTTILSIKRSEDLERWRGAKGNRTADKIMHDAADLGTRAHAEVEAINRGTPIEQVLASCSEDVRHPVRAYHRWFREEVAEILDVEYFVANYEDGYAGAFDFRCRLVRGLIALVDYKTSSMPHDEWRMQTAGYKRALRKKGVPCDLRIGLDCPRDNENAVDGRIYPMEYGPEDDDEDEGAFLAALTLWNWQRRQDERCPRLMLRRSSRR